MVDISVMASSATGALILLIFVGIGAMLIGDNTGINSRLLGIVGAGIALYIIYKTQIE